MNNNQNENNNNSSKKPILMVGTIINFILGGVHLVLWIITDRLLKGHSYGPTDRYGDRAKGLTWGEVARIEYLIPILFALFIAMVVTVFLSIKKINPNMPMQEKSKYFSLMTIPAIICGIGSILTVISYLAYH